MPIQPTAVDELGHFRGCLLGLAVGDAIGTTAEFRPRGSFPNVIRIDSEGPFSLVSGQWTHGTSMAMCLAAGLLETGASTRRIRRREIVAARRRCPLRALAPPTAGPNASTPAA